MDEEQRLLRLSDAVLVDLWRWAHPSTDAPAMLAEARAEYAAGIEWLFGVRAGPHGRPVSVADIAKMLADIDTCLPACFDPAVAAIMRGWLGQTMKLFMGIPARAAWTERPRRRS